MILAMKMLDQLIEDEGQPRSRAGARHHAPPERETTKNWLHKYLKAIRRPSSDNPVSVGRDGL